ncbi:hypothetical protein BC833DRAFT_620966 [Globomyces pollinis-pini]|nr:hypothetical protein BC833DRAFT_620966 [Globomyces pollinis-pini]KAJ2998794.1 Transmembrane protein 17 [Globomyces sp. JEL0801]
MREFRDTVKIKWDDKLERLSKYLYPEYSTVKPLKEDFYAHEIVASLPFQMLMYINILLFPIYLFGSLASFFWKMKWTHISGWSFYQTSILLLMFTTCEPIRLWIGFHGNKNEHVPGVSGSVLFACFPQLPVTLFYLFLQEFCGGGFTTPLDYAINIVYASLLFAEIILGYYTAKKIVQAQMTQFFTTFETTKVNIPKAA